MNECIGNVNSKNYICTYKPTVLTQMKDRIQQIIDYKGISPGDLAEKLDVQRSNISHILNGRNKPGALFIEKILHAFPNINARWLLTGEGPMVLNDAEDESQEANSLLEKGPGGKQELLSTNIPVAATASAGKGKTIDKIVLLYSDGTFTYYNNK